MEGMLGEAASASLKPGGRKAEKKMK